MQIVIKSKNLQLTDSLRSYTEKKVGKLARFLPTVSEARVELTVQNTRSYQERQIAQITMRDGSGFVLRAEQRSSDLRSSLDGALERLERQIKRYKGKHWQANIRGATTEVVEEAEEADTEPDGLLVRTKTFECRPMAVEEAIEQMELLGHDFFVFFNSSTSGFSVVYRRHDGGYGLLQPELA